MICEITAFEIFCLVGLTVFHKPFLFFEERNTKTTMNKNVFSVALLVASVVALAACANVHEPLNFEADADAYSGSSWITPSEVNEFLKKIIIIILVCVGGVVAIIMLTVVMCCCCSVACCAATTSSITAKQQGYVVV